MPLRFYSPPPPSRYEADPPPAPEGYDALSWNMMWLQRRSQDRERAAQYRRSFAQALWVRVHGPPPKSWPPDVIHLTNHAEANAATDARTAWPPGDAQRPIAAAGNLAGQHSQTEGSRPFFISEDTE